VSRACASSRLRAARGDLGQATHAFGNGEMARLSGVLILALVCSLLGAGTARLDSMFVAFPFGKPVATFPGNALDSMSVAFPFGKPVATFPGNALAADKYPSRPVHFIVGFPAGGPVDTVARIMGDWLSQQLGQPFVIENRAGSGGMIATNAAIHSQPDGYTILFVGSNNAIGVSLYKHLAFDFLRDTTPVAGMLRLPNIMIVTPSLPVNSVAELIDYAKARPGQLNYASAGNGTSLHLSAELFKSMTGTNMIHVPYRGAAAFYPDLMSGKVHMAFENLPGAIGFVKSGRLRALGVTTSTRSAAVPDVPTIGETVAGYEANVFYGIAAPNGTPPEAVEILNRAVTAALTDPKMVARFADLGSVPMPLTPPEFGQLMVEEIEKWRKVVEFSGASVD
jgi:tripartite-type tricarboxylate transporter receptor subunit TctC